MNFQAMKYLLLTGAVSLSLLPGFSGLTLAQLHSGTDAIAETGLTKSGAMTLSGVHTVYIAPFTPDSGGFRGNIIDGLKSWGHFTIVSSISQADAVIRGSAASTGYGFRGQIAVVSTKDNRVLWSGAATRRDGTGDGMAFNQLISRLKAATR